MKENKYKLGIIGGGIKIDREITEEAVTKIMAIIMGVNFSSTTLTGGGNPLPPILGFGGEKDKEEVPTPKVFLAQKKPSSEIERITTLAYYITRYRGVSKFKTLDLTKLNTEAAQRNFSNAAVFARDADKAEYLSKAGGGAKQITLLGEAVVDALPDREKVKQVIIEYKSNRSRKARKSTKKKK